MRQLKIQGDIERIVCEMHAQGITSTRISRHLKELGTEISPSAIWQYLNKPKNLPTIQKYIDKYRSNPLAVAIAHKRVRLEDLNRERITLLNTLRLYKTEEDTIKKDKFKKYMYALKRLIEIEIAGRDEIEKKPDMVAFFQRIGPLSEKSDAELRKELREIDQQLVIIARGSQEAPEQKGPDSSGAEATHTQKSS